MRTKKRKNGDCEMRILNSIGDSAYYWNPDSKMESAGALKKFNELQAQKYNAFALDESGKGTLLKDFSVKTKKVVFSKPIVGG